MQKGHQTIEQYVLSVLRQDILTGVYQRGDRLRQDDMSRRLGVSTTPIREAFRDLRSEGLVEIGPNRGVVVRGLTARDVAEIYELRMLLEPLLARKAVQTADEKGLAHAQSLHERMCASNDPHEWSELNEVFHITLLESQRESRLHQIVSTLCSIAVPYVALSIYLDAEIRQNNNREHADILRYFHARDADAAEREVRVHLSSTLQTVLDSVTETDELPATPKAVSTSPA